MFDPARRSRETEWMDTEAVNQADYDACLADLNTVNTVTLARLPTLAFIRRAARRVPGRELHVLDVGCGEGDMLRRLHRWSTRTGHALALTGVDHNPQGIAAARAATPGHLPITYRVADAFDPALGTFDVVISSLVTHHMVDEEVVAFLRRMEGTAGLGWFVNDLHRSRVAYHGFQVLSAVAGWHRFVRHDGPVSVARSFRRADWQELVHRAGVAATVRWHLPYRYCVTRLR